MVLGLNGAQRKEGTTTRLTLAALEGAASAGAETEMILLRDQDVRHCANCLTCYKDLESDIGSCPIDDDVGEILRKVIAADGIILSSPVHNGFITGLMTVFFERMAWRLCRPTGRIMTFRGAPESRSKKARALATIVSAGSMPTKLGEKYCNDGTPFMKQNGCLILNADWVGSVYAGGEFSKKLQGDDWQRAYFFKELSEQQIKQAHDLGLKMAEKINADSLRPLHPFGRLGPFLDTVTGWFIRE